MDLHLEEVDGALVSLAARGGGIVVNRTIGLGMTQPATMATLERIKTIYADADATLDDLREAVTTLVETERTARRVLGSTHPLAEAIADSLRNAQAALRARETPPAGDTAAEGN